MKTRKYSNLIFFGVLVSLGLIAKEDPLETIRRREASNKKWQLEEQKKMAENRKKQRAEKRKKKREELARKRRQRAEQREKEKSSHN
jgi:hypothetical protein